MSWLTQAYLYIYGSTTLNKPKSMEVSADGGIVTQNIFNLAPPTSSETNKNTEKLWFCEYLMSISFVKDIDQMIVLWYSRRYVQRQI